MSLESFLRELKDKNGPNRTTDTMMAPNRYCWLESATAWYKVSVTGPSIIVPVGTPGSVSYTFGPGMPVAAELTQSEVYQMRNGFGLLFAKGDWWFNVQLAGSAAATQCFVVKDIGDLDSSTVMTIIQGTASDPIDLVRWGGALLSAARDADGAADFAAALIGGLVNTRPGIYQRSSADWNRHYGDTPVDAQGIGHSAIIAAYANALALGRDTSDNTLRLIETRAAAGNQAATLYRLLTDAAQRVYDIANTRWDAVGGGLDTSGGVMGGLSLDAKGSSYWASFRGRKFRVTDEGASVTCSNGFTATAPRFTLEAGATNELIIRKIKVAVLAAGTTNFRVRVILDPDARYSSGGTAGTVGARVNMNGGSATAVGFTYHYGGITATATDADEREVETTTVVNVTGNGVELTFEDGLIVPASGTLLIYLYDAGAAGTGHVMVEGEEANVQ